MASYCDIGDLRNVAWLFALPSRRLLGSPIVVSFAPDGMALTIGGEKFEPVHGPAVLPRGPDRSLSVDRLAGVRLVEPAAPEGASA